MTLKPLLAFNSTTQLTVAQSGLLYIITSLEKEGRVKKTTPPEDHETVSSVKAKDF